MIDFGDNGHDSHHRYSTPSVYRHRVGPGGNFMVSPIQLVDR